jgi:hypothetical protein
LLFQYTPAVNTVRCIGCASDFCLGTGLRHLCLRRVICPSPRVIGVRFPPHSRIWGWFGCHRHDLRGGWRGSFGRSHPFPLHRSPHQAKLLDVCGALLPGFILAVVTDSVA